MLTAKGFKRKRYNDFVSEMEEQAQALYGSDVNLSVNSPLGKFIQLIAYGRAEENELAESVYFSSFYKVAEGASLDYVAKNNGLLRIQEKKAIGTVTFGVDGGTTVEAGLIVATTDDIEFTTVETVTAGTTQTSIDVKIEAVLAGPSGNVPANTITVINTPTAGVNTVNNAAQTTEGRATETDSQLRSRYERSFSNGGGASIPALRAALLEVDGVSDAIVEENDSNSEVNGMPPKSFSAYVFGGLDGDIAKTLFNKKSAGIKPHGAVSVVVSDSLGNSHTMEFNRANKQDIYVKLTLVKNSNFPSDGDAQIKQNIIEYIGGVDSTGVEHLGAGMGGDVIHYKVISEVADVAGIDDVTVELSKDGTTFVTSNVAIDSKTIARTDVNKITIV